MHFHNFTLAAADPNWGGTEVEHAKSGTCVSIEKNMVCELPEEQLNWCCRACKNS